LPIELVDAGYELARLAAALAADRKASLTTGDADFAKLDRRLTLPWIR
jgi:hypothetical protein